MTAPHTSYNVRHDDGASPLYAMLWLFSFALAIRWIYALGLYATMGDAGIVAADGYGYLSDARKYVDLIRTGELQAPQWIGTNTGVMPLFSWLLALHVAAFGDYAAL